jgi:hypothetical protein
MTRVAPRPPGRPSNAPEPWQGRQPKPPTGTREGSVRVGAPGGTDSRRPVRLPSLFLALGDPLPSEYYFG